ncbi:hypothetical protein D3C80_1547470 [compost metagenome]
MGLQVEAEVEQRLSQNAVHAQIQGYKQTADTTITVEKRMDRFKLHMQQSSFDQCRQARLVVMHETFERIQATGHFSYGWRHKKCVTGPRSANPILRAAEFSRILSASSPTV